MLVRKPPSHENESGTMTMTSTTTATPQSSARLNMRGRRRRGDFAGGATAASANETSPFEIAPEREPLVQQGDEQRQHEDHDRDRAGVAEQVLAELVVQ